MTTLSLHRERFQAEQAPARSSWYLAADSNELAMVSGSGPAFGPDFTTTINPEVDR